MQWKKPEIDHEPKTASLSDVGAAVKQSAFDLDELNAVIKRLKCNKSPGPDEVTTELVKWLNNDNRQNLLIHFNDILLHGNYPESLNLSNIASIYKKGDPAKLENYRPIALLQTFKKNVGSSCQEPFRTCTGAVDVKSPVWLPKEEVYIASLIYRKKTYGYGRKARYQSNACIIRLGKGF